MNISDLLDTLERQTYGEEEYQRRHTPQICVFVRPDGRVMYSKVAKPAEVDNVPYEGEIYKVVRENFTAGDFFDGHRDLKTFLAALWEAGVCEEELTSIVNDLTERKNSDGSPRRDNKSHVAYKQPVARKEGMIAFVIE